MVNAMVWEFSQRATTGRHGSWERVSRLIYGCLLGCSTLVMVTPAIHAAEPAAPTLKTEYGTVSIFPADNPWNQEIARLPIHPRSAAYLNSVGLDRPLHPDFGTTYQGAPSGIPYVVVGPQQSTTKIEFEYGDESDPGPYPIPADPPIEGGPKAPLDSDRHVLIIDPQRRKLFELYHVVRRPNGTWSAGSGAIFDLSSNQLRPAGWTSADAAGLPVFPGLARYDEIVERGELRHALRFTVRKTQRAYIAPARHFASKSTDSNLPPMGLRVRLRADYDVSRFPPPAQVLLKGLKQYGMLLADNGGDWFVSGAPDPRWDDDALATLKRVKVRDFECVDTGPLVTK